MKKYLLLVPILIFLTSISNVSAEPILTNVSKQPQNIWFDENITISLNCYDDNYNITQVYGKIVSPIVSENLVFTSESNNYYTLKLTNLYFDPEKPPNYNFSIYCQNNNNQTNTTSISFNVSQLKASISSITPSYLGDTVEITISIEKDSSLLYSEGIGFDLKLGGQDWPKTSFYDPIKKSWVIKFNTPNVLGTYDLNLEISVDLESYSQKKLTLKSSIEVKEPIELKILSIDKNEVRSDDIITISLSASERGKNIILNKEYLNFQIGSVAIEQDKVILYSVGDYFNAKIPMPDLSAGLYKLKITLNYKNYSIAKTREIGYVLPISGEFVDLNNKGINVEIKFLIDGNEKKRLTTDNLGSYSGYVVPGTYTLQLTFSQSTLYLYGTKVDNFNDPIKYYFFDTDIEGIKIAGLFVYEVALQYSNAKILMSYDEKKVANEKDLVVYRCGEFNPANKICNTKWEEQTATIDTIRNIVTIEASSLSAYAIGTKKSLYLDFSSEKDVFSIKELIRIRGITRDEDGNFVPNVLVNASVDGIKASTFSDDNGVFNLEFFAPDQEGVYNLLLTVKKTPYLSFNKTWSFKVIKSRSITLVTPDTIRIKKGGNLTLTFSIVNTGQTDLLNLSLFLIGLPKTYFNLQDKIDELKINQEKKVPVNFKIPIDASESTLSLIFKVNSTEVSKEEVIGFTIISENVTLPTTTTPPFTFPTGAVTLPTLPISFSEISYALIFGVISISTAYFLRMRKAGIKERKHIKNLLSDIKREIKKKKVHPMQSFNQLVENIEKK